LFSLVKFKFYGPCFIKYLNKKGYKDVYVDSEYSINEIIF